MNKGYAFDRQTERNSGIELLKVCAIFLIVLSHVVHTLSSKNPYISYQGYILNLSVATTDIQHLILIILSYSGHFGNLLFFIPSAWFLIDSKRVNAKRWFSMLVEIWVISVAILLIIYTARSGDIDFDLIMRSILPTLSCQNWYMSCYLLFYPMHLILNKIICGMSQIELFRSASALGVIYIGYNFINPDGLFGSKIILWITFYFIVSYAKIYFPDIISSKKYNILFVCLGAAGHIGLILLTNFLGLHFEFFSTRVKYWRNDCNPFLFLMAFGLFQLARTATFKNKFINRISALSMLIYVIHENIILRTYYRPYIVNFIYEKYGYDHVLLEMLMLTVTIFVGATLISFLYDITLRKTVYKLSLKIHDLCAVVWNWFESMCLKLH